MQAGNVLSISVEDAAGFPDGILFTIQDDGVGIAEAIAQGATRTTKTK